MTTPYAHPSRPITAIAASSMPGASARSGRFAARIRRLCAALGLLALAGAQAQALDLQMNGAIKIDPTIIKALPGPLPVQIIGKGCTFYEHKNGGGERWHKAVGWVAAKYSDQTSYAEVVTYTGDWWNDRISSLTCDDSDKVHCSVAVYPDRDRRGGEAIFWGGMGMINLDRWGLNDKVSSFSIFCNLMK
ncbi:hypothetical protein [Devosia sp. 63-57]|uniref:hypothetical protein n=1 Tax=Devosia sp. 63-57 TaxID=1895751 RepID=UPI00257C174B|nr:hypothetical protein [Devosia sp. 63-57]